MSEAQSYPILDFRGERRVVGQGMTTDTPSPSGLPAFQDPVKEMMCVVMCACKKVLEENREAAEADTDDEKPGPDATAAAPETAESSTTKPRRLQQNCVATLFQTLDKAADYKSWVKAEVYYDMEGYPARFRSMDDKTDGQPQPLMARDSATKPLKWHWGVISHVGRRKNPKLSQPTFTGQGESLRRPDVTVVRNPERPPVESNISMIFEMKFDEPVNQRQITAYRKIVLGDRDRVQAIEVKHCRCEKRGERIRQLSHEELMAWVAAVNAAMAAAGKNKDDPNGGLSPVVVQVGLAIVGAFVLGVLAMALLPASVVAAIAAFVALMLGGTLSAAR